GKVVAMNGATCKVEIPGAGNVQALAVNVEVAGRPTVLSLRPERVKLNPAPGSLPNIFGAHVAEVIYLGDHVRARILLCGQDDFVIKLPNSDGVVQLEPGTVITIGWKTEDCLALDASRRWTKAPLVRW
uniref:TOBE domain-containing protein n=1 Tax=Bradyrhizobium sp. WSM1743 TaxID=318996 RepID=UPI00056713B4